VSKLQRILIIFIAILAQSALAIAAGTIGMYLVYSSKLPQNTIVDGLNIGGLSKSNAVAAIRDHYKETINSGIIKIRLDNSIYNIQFSELEPQIDAEASLNLLKQSSFYKFLPIMFNSYFGNGKLELKPSFKFSEGKLRQKLIELAKTIDKTPENASISMKEGKIYKRAETNGYRLKVAAIAENISKKLSSILVDGFVLENGNKEQFDIVVPQIRLKDLDDYNIVLAQNEITITDEDLMPSIQQSVEAINGKVIADEEFSFIEALRVGKASFQNDNEGFDLVASSLYMTVLEAGIAKNSIMRLPHLLAVEYAEPGLDAWISGNGGDLKFKNTFSHKIIIFSGIEDGKLHIWLVGNLSDKPLKTDLKVEVIQKFNPTVVNIENKALKTGQRVVLSPGKEGLLVEVTRNGETISRDRYEPEKAIIQIGPGTLTEQLDK